MKTFDSIAIGSLTLRNRLVMAPVKTAFGDIEGKVTDRLIRYYRRRARGGVGAIIVEPLFVATAGKEHPKQLGAAHDGQVAGLRRLVEAIHEHGAAAIAHLNHAGRAANPKASGTAPEAPSAVRCETTGATPVPLTRERIDAIVSAFGEAASRAVAAGFDAVEVQCGLGYLVAQFYSPRTNMRDDDYGGTEENRARFARRVLEAVRKGTGDRIPVTARISGTEQAPGGLDPAAAVALAALLEAAGVAALHVASGSACDSPPWYYQHMALPEEVNARFARDIKQHANVPVIAAGRLGDPALIERLISEGGVDLVALGRPLVADPDLPRKMQEDRAGQVIQCGACLQGCLVGVKSGKGIGCIVNPEPGREGEPMPERGAQRRIVVVGAGPAGLTVARMASERGHEVIVLERSQTVLGGQFAVSYLAPGKQAMRKTLDSLIRVATKSGADIRMGVDADADTVASLEPDVAVVATGAVPARLPIPGIEDTLTGEDILTEAVEPGRDVLVIGGGLIGIEVAEFLAARGREVVVVEMMQEIARDMEPITRKITMKRIASMPITILTGTTVKAIENGMATVTGPDGERALGPFEAIVTAVGTRPRDELSASLRARGIEVHVVGDAKEIGQVQGAVRSAWELGIRLSAA